MSYLYIFVKTFDSRLDKLKILKICTAYLNNLVKKSESFKQLNKFPVIAHTLIHRTLLHIACAVIDKFSVRLNKNYLGPLNITFKTTS